MIGRWISTWKIQTPVRPPRDMLHDSKIMFTLNFPKISHLLSPQKTAIFQRIIKISIFSKLQKAPKILNAKIYFIINNLKIALVTTFFKIF